MNIPPELLAMQGHGAVNISPTLLRDGYYLEANAYAAKDAGLVLPSITTYHSEDRQRFGYTVKVNDPRPNLVKCAPECLMMDSYKPWSPLPQNWVGPLPKLVDEIESIYVDFNFQWDATGGANICLEMWLMRSRDGVVITEGTPEEIEKSQSQIVAEVMVWLDHKGNIRPAGKQVETAKDSMIGWDLWMSPGYASESGPPWPYFAYVAPFQMCSGPLDMMQFLKHLKFRSYIATYELPVWARTCELLMEVIDGEAWILVNKIEARLK